MIRLASCWLAALTVCASAAGQEASLAEKQLRKLAGVRPLYVEDLIGDGAHSIRDLIVSAVHARIGEEVAASKPIVTIG